MSLNEITGDQLCSKFGGSEAKRKFDEGLDRILRIQAANINHSAACNEQNDELELKYRAEIHALTEIILDNSAIMFLCVHKMADS